MGDLTAVELLGGATLTATVIIAGFAGWSAWAATQAAKATAKSTEAQLVRQFLEEHSSLDMHDALKALGALKNTPDLLRKITSGEQEIGVENEVYRRRVKLYFLKALKLHKGGFISDEALKLIADISGRRLLKEVVLPLSKAVGVTDSAPENEEKWVKELDSVCPPTQDPPGS